VAVLTANRPPSDPAATFEVDGETYAFVKDLPRPEHFEIKIGPFPVVK